MNIEIKSRKHGTHIVYFDDDLSDLVMGYTWSLSKKGERLYAVTCLMPSRKMLYMHHLITGYKRGSGKHVDHIDDNGLNNAKSNLRICKISQNLMNRGKNKNNTTGFKGVFKTAEGNFYAQIKVNRITIHGGRFNSPAEAAIKYNELAIKYHGKFAHLNKIP